MHNILRLCKKQENIHILCRGVFMLNDEIFRLIRFEKNNQKLLAQKLAKLGYKMTQSTLSRKLKEMNIKKINGRYTYVEPELKKIKRMELVEPNLFVIRTMPGHAGAIAGQIDKFIDEGNCQEFVGTIAGDDTIFLAVSSYKSDAWIIAKLRQFLTF
jgi:transcriptional regulator of arginine metabolism